jgi:PAS domain S-box-containing protein
LTDIDALLDGVPDRVAIVDADGQILAVNVALVAMTGFPRNALVGNSVEDLVPLADRDHHVRSRAGFTRAPFIRSMNTGINTRILCRDGAEKKVEIMIRPLSWEGRQAFMAVVRE